jgi:hypothetical protein
VLQVGEEDIKEQMAKVKSGGVATVGQATKAGVKSRREVLEEYLVGLALRFGKLQKLTAPETSKQIKSPFWKKVIEAWGEAQNGNLQVREIVQSLPAELRAKTEGLLLIEDELPETEVEKEWNKAMRDLEEVEIREQLEDLFKSSDKDGVPEKAKELTRRLAELTKG